jgi:secondary thiamine-phosphate synthase enzyme
MTVRNTTITLKTKREFDVIDLTEKVKDFAENSGIKNGLVNVQTLHTTATVFVNENEPLLIEDFKSHLEKLAPKNQKYNHDDFLRRRVNMCEDECANGRSHCRAINMPTNVCLNLISGKLQLGAWQKILFIELDRPRERQVQIQIMGE